MSSRWIFIRCVWALLALCSAVLPSRAATSVVQTEQVRAELLAHAPQGIAPGQPLWLGLRIEHQPHWHTYWKNPGDSGLPTTLEWSLPAGFVAGEVAWPTPRRLAVGPLMNFGYEGTLLLAVPIEVPATFAGERLAIKLAAQWLVCKDVCIPESGEFSLELPTRAATVAHAAAFEAARAALPQRLQDASASASVAQGALQLRVQGLPEAWRGRTLHAFPETAGVIENAAPIRGAWSEGTWTAGLALSAQRSESPSRMPVVLALADAGAAGVRVDVPISGPWPAAAAPTAATPTVEGNAASALPWLASLAFALVGGLLLNLMPCVFPVLSLKVIALGSHGTDRGHALAAALAYTAGVVISFVVLAGLLLALRAGGEQLGWGFQLQSPLFVAGLALLFTLIGLNLAGVFEFDALIMGSRAGSLVGSLAGLRLRNPVADSALTGVLAVAVASPCTAPFMGASLGAALTMPAAQALTVFAALGLGMALPFLAVSIWPALSRALPRPGAWMRRFKMLMAFPMFATVVWLLWVLGQQTGPDGMVAVLGALLAAAFAVWMLGDTASAGKARGIAMVAAAGVLGATLAWAWPSLRTLPGDAGAAIASPSGVDAKAGWQPWSPQAVQSALAQGQPVFVDFTAAWCVTCQFNKRTVFADAQVLADFEAKRVTLLRADWTRRDPAITQALAQLGRSGVPVYLLQAPGAAPRLLSELPSVSEVRSALAALP